MNLIRTLCLIPFAAVLFGCLSQPKIPMKTMTNINTQRFMGDWHVLANIPTFAERDAVNPMENYQMRDDGTIDITFSFNDSGSSSKPKQLSMKGFVDPLPGNGVWKVQFVWPFKADYRIAYVDPNYQLAIIARQKRDYLWIMSRSPNIDEAIFDQLISRAAELGYRPEDIQRTSWQPALKKAG